MKSERACVEKAVISCVYSSPNPFSSLSFAVWMWLSSSASVLIAFPSASTRCQPSARRPLFTGATFIFARSASTSHASE